MIVRVKVCCIASQAEVELAVRFGASALGLVSAMPSGPGVIAEEAIAHIAGRVPPGIGTFLLTSSQSVPAIIAQQRRCRTNTIQLTDRVTDGSLDDLKAALPGIAIVQVIHVTGWAAVEEALEIAPHADALLLDSGDPHAAVKELGGTGRVHNWTISREIVRRCGKPVFLAGGLNPENAREALETVRPYALDVCSGLRVNGKLDEGRLDAFMQVVRAFD